MTHLIQATEQLLQQCIEKEIQRDFLDSQITCKEVSALYDSRPSRRTIYNWMTIGCLSKATKERVILQSSVSGGRLYTTRRWVKDFNEQLSRRV